MTYSSQVIEKDSRGEVAMRLLRYFIKKKRTVNTLEPDPQFQELALRYNALREYFFQFMKNGTRERLERLFPISLSFQNSLKIADENYHKLWIAVETTITTQYQTYNEARDIETKQREWNRLKNFIQGLINLGFEKETLGILRQNRFPWKSLIRA